MGLDLGERGGGDVGRAEQGDVRRDERGHRVAGRRPGAVEPPAPGLGDADGDTDPQRPVGRHVEGHVQLAGRRKPTRSYTWPRVVTETARAFSAPMASSLSRWAGSSRYALVRSCTGRTNPATTSARSFFRSP